MRRRKKKMMNSRHKPNQKLRKVRIAKIKMIVMMMKKMFKQSLKAHFKQETNTAEIGMECSITIRTTLSYEIKSMNKKADTRTCSIP
jgi:hypothetical protein